MADPSACLRLACWSGFRTLLLVVSLVCVALLTLRVRPSGRCGLLRVLRLEKSLSRHSCLPGTCLRRLRDRISPDPCWKINVGGDLRTAIALDMQAPALRVGVRPSGRFSFTASPPRETPPPAGSSSQRCLPSVQFRPLPNRSCRCLSWGKSAAFASGVALAAHGGTFAATGSLAVPLPPTLLSLRNLARTRIRGIFPVGPECSFRSNCRFDRDLRIIGRESREQPVQS